MSVASIIRCLEEARDYQKRYPGLMVGYAVGLTVFDPDVAVQYAPLLEGRNLSDGCPADGVIPEEVYRAARGRYVKMDKNLVSARGFGLDPSDPEALSEQAIDRLRPLITD